MSDNFITAREAAQVMRCHEKTVRRLILRGELPGRLVAGKYLIDLGKPREQMSAGRVAERGGAVAYSVVREAGELDDLMGAA